MLTLNWQQRHPPEQDDCWSEWYAQVEGAEARVWWDGFCCYGVLVMRNGSRIRYDLSSLDIEKAKIEFERKYL